MDFSDIDIRTISRNDCKPFLLQIHYAKRMPQVKFAFGAFYNNDLLGVITYGVPANSNLNSLGNFGCLELNRLCLKDNIKNLSSFLIGNSLKLLPKPLALVSYADSLYNHCDYVYQATNWIYCGISKGDKEYQINGKLFHRKNCFNKFGTGSLVKIQELFGADNVKVIMQGDKYRYFQLLGDKKQKKEMRITLESKYKILPYPKITKE